MEHRAIRGSRGRKSGYRAEGEGVRKEEEAARGCRTFVKFPVAGENKDRGSPAWESFVISRPAISFPYCRVNDALAGSGRVDRRRRGRV